MDSKRSAKSGAFLEILGSYNPKTKKIQLKNEIIKNWIIKGAQLSNTAHNLLVGAKVIDGPKINVVRAKAKVKVTA
jgi:small subunit ribosomal protein S16